MANQPDSIFTAGFNPVTRSTVWKCEDCHLRWEGRSSEHECKFPGPTLQSVPTLQSLLESHGSFRRLIDAYWTSRLSPTEERIIEDATPKETIASFKPAQCDRAHVSDIPLPPDPYERKFVTITNDERQDIEIDELLKAGWYTDPSRTYKVGDTVEFKQVKPFSEASAIRSYPRSSTRAMAGNEPKSVASGRDGQVFRNSTMGTMKRKFQNVDHLPADSSAAYDTMMDDFASIVRSTYEYAPGRWFHACSDQVLLKLIAPERHLHGLWIPDSAKRQAYELWQGEVLAVGPGEWSKAGHRKPIDVKPGDRVCFYSVGGRTATRWPTKEHVILSAEYLQCVVEA